LRRSPRAVGAGTRSALPRLLQGRPFTRRQVGLLFSPTSRTRCATVDLVFVFTAGSEAMRSSQVRRWPTVPPGSHSLRCIRGRVWLFFVPSLVSAHRIVGSGTTAPQRSGSPPL